MAKIEVPIDPPSEWFSPPADIPTDKRVTIEPSGRVYGYIALWNTCHVGHGDCVKPPQGSPSDYEYAHQGETLTAEGDLIKTAVIAGGLGHAPVDMKTALVPSYYENTGTQLMRVRYGEDQNGLWFAGALWPGVDDLQVAHIRASSISGDWRFHAAWRQTPTAYDFAGACLVNIPGFAMQSEGSISNRSGRPFALAAAALNLEGDFMVFENGELLTAGALPYKATAKADPSTPWNGPAVVAQVSGEAKLRQIHAWVDSEGDPEAKSSYKLPHHNADGQVVLRGVQAAMGALLGARGGVNIPASDRRAVYNHLASHYRQFGEEPPKLTASLGDLMDEEETNCDGNCTECTCNKLNQEQEDEILAAAYQIVAKRRKKGTIQADGSETEEDTSSETNELDVLSTKVDTLTSLVEGLVADQLAKEIEAEA